MESGWCFQGQQPVLFYVFDDDWEGEYLSVHAYEMPGQRFDVGSIEGYEKIKREYKGLVN